MIRLLVKLVLIFAVQVSLILAAGCSRGGGGGGGGDSSNGTGDGTTKILVKPINTTQNIQPIAVDGGPASSGKRIYPNAAFTSVTVCIPGTTTCQTISGILVDTASYGLRLLSSALQITLPASINGGNAVGECIQFVDGTILWGPVKSADVKMAGETASAVPIQLIDANFNVIPSDCENQGVNVVNTLDGLGANGILGVGHYQHDCGNRCDPSSGGTPKPGTYYACSSGGCQAVFMPLTEQVQNPVALFAKDNNGVIIDLPADSGTQTTIQGTMIFGIDTQANNALANATVFTLNANSGITTVYKNTSLPHSFIDSGSNAYFFADQTIPSNAQSFYIPSTTLNLSAINHGANGTSNTVVFNIANADDLFNNGYNNTDFILSMLAGHISSISLSFDWGLPFFYGRRVYCALEGMSTSAGPGPYWAY